MLSFGYGFAACVVKWSTAFLRERCCRILLSWKAARRAPHPSHFCRSGGIGRRAWFRSMYPQGCGGSSPFFGTICSKVFPGQLKLREVAYEDLGRLRHTAATFLCSADGTDEQTNATIH